MFIAQAMLGQDAGQMKTTGRIWSRQVWAAPQDGRLPQAGHGGTTGLRGQPRRQDLYPRAGDADGFATGSQAHASAEIQKHDQWCACPAEQSAKRSLHSGRALPDRNSCIWPAASTPGGCLQAKAGPKLLGGCVRHRDGLARLSGTAVQHRRLMLMPFACARFGLEASTEKQVLKNACPQEQGSQPVGERQKAQSPLKKAQAELSLGQGKAESPRKTNNPQTAFSPGKRTDPDALSRGTKVDPKAPVEDGRGKPRKLGLKIPHASPRPAGPSVSSQAGVIGKPIKRECLSE